MIGKRNRDKWLKFQNENGNDSIIESDEIFATHYENLLRKEHNLPLRKSYDSMNILPVLDSKGRNLYYNAAGETGYKRINKNDRYEYCKHPTKCIL